MKTTDPFPLLLHTFFYEWLVQQRNASVHTVRSYRDSWRLFLRFLAQQDRKSTRLNSSHVRISYAVFCLKKKKFNSITKTGTLKRNRISKLTSRSCLPALSRQLPPTSGSFRTSCRIHALSSSTSAMYTQR